MSTFDDTATNIARDSAYVGVQASVVHGDIYTYTTSPDATPAEKFETGVRLLEIGASGRAWELISEAVAARHLTNRVCFYWLLALMSGRTRLELSKEEAAQLRNAPNTLRLTGDDPWADAVKMIHRLLECAEKRDADLRLLFKEFDELGDAQRSMILRHMELFLGGSLKEQVWHRTIIRAEREQTAGKREKRVWKFFEPDPAGPRRREPRSATIPFTTWLQAVPATAVFGAAAIHIGYLLAQGGRISALLLYLLSIAGGYFGARNAVEWRFRTVRLRTKDKEYATPHLRRSAPSGGFASKVDQRFDYYFAKYVPRGASRDMWLAATAGIRSSIRDEIVEVYRETSVSVEKITWLIRHRVSSVRSRWEKGTLWSYRRELATPTPAKAAAVFGVAVLLGGGIWAAGSAVLVSPLSGARSSLLALAGGWIAARAWLRIALERRRAAADKFESERVLEGSKKAFIRWQAELADKPEDREMAEWLDCDRKVLLNEALQHYKLTMSNIIAHAFIETPAASNHKRAQVVNGPWRYLKYQILIFVLTQDGVRQLTVTLDFERGTFHVRQRANFRFEAIAAVHVSQADNNERTFELALVNGQNIRVQVMGPEGEKIQEGEDPGAVSDVTLDAAGLHHTLHVLEGIAAEGKKWILP
ncbi:hypothetical protein [Microtetraspora malaysiensis]|uniref:hypothetical protein n=1 Tax=Microtetraspora malaysiensis TaxID=161358 RepID=UPI0008352864|nr:hypothetical protein [Microtetraspora malaysiensis]